VKKERHVRYQPHDRLRIHAGESRVLFPESTSSPFARSRERGAHTLSDTESKKRRGRGGRTFGNRKRGDELAPGAHYEGQHARAHVQRWRRLR